MEVIGNGDWVYTVAEEEDWRHVGSGVRGGGCGGDEMTD